jgi:hypothetical protein
MNKLAKQQNSVGIQIKLSEIPTISRTEALVYNSNISQKKFKDYNSKKELLVMTALITKWASFVGARPPEAIELNTLANFIKESFPNFNHEDLNMCISMLVNEKLDVNENCYGALSPLYCSKILRAYESYKFNILHKVRDEVQKIQLSIPKPIDKNIRVENFKKLLIYAKEDAIKETYLDSGDVIYSFIKKNNLIKYTKEIDAESKNYANEIIALNKKNEVKKAVIQNKNLNLIKNQIENHKNSAVKYQKEYIVNFWLKNYPIEEIAKTIKYEMIE